MGGKRKEEEMIAIRPTKKRKLSSHHRYICLIPIFKI